jgi:hypothetical protein
MVRLDDTASSSGNGRLWLYNANGTLFICLAALMPILATSLAVAQSAGFDLSWNATDGGGRG